MHVKEASELRKRFNLGKHFNHITQLLLYTENLRTSVNFRKFHTFLSRTKIEFVKNLKAVRAHGTYSYTHFTKNLFCEQFTNL